MTKIIRGGQAGALNHLSSSQATYRAQIAALADAVRQLGGNAEIGPGALLNDPLSAPYVIHVNPFTGKDTFVSGSYSTTGSATQRIELQRLECGYTISRPFRTLNRAIIEAGIITAKSYYEAPLGNNDLVSIVLAPGAMNVLNDVGAAQVLEWENGKEPSDSELQAFNPAATGGILLPRGCSLVAVSSDLRKTILRPAFVPTPEDEAADASNRRAIFKVTGTGYYWGLTFMDKVGSTSSHHLLHCFEFASKAELDEFYAKIRQAFAGPNNTGGLNPVLAVTRTGEYEITAPQPASGSQTIAIDTTTSASPYIFNCSIRSNYGLCGVFADGSKPTGFKSMVIAQFTGVSLQRDLSCWEKYSSNTWGAFVNYADYISTSPNSVRMNPERRSFHVRAINNAVIQEVSVFAIGQGVHHWTQSGGEITITNSNSNFGGCAAISEGYRTNSFESDSSWNVSSIRVSDNLSGLTNNVRRIYLGTISAITASTIDLTTDLGESATVAGVPDIVAKDGYTFREDSYLWVENPLGKDWRTTFTASAWSTADPNRLNISAAIEDEDGTAPGATNAGVSNAIGKRVYIRRFVDTRTPEQRRYTLKLANTNVSARLPVRDYVLQTDTTDVVINSEFASNQVLLVQNTGATTIPGAALGAEIVLRRGNTAQSWTANATYKKGDTVTRNNKHFTCIEENQDAAFDANKWSESYVHMASTYNPEDFYKNESPILIFDDDTAGTENSTTLGYDFTTLWGSNTLIQNQYRAATDYRALHLFLTALGFTSAQAHTILTPQPGASRDLNPSDSGDMGGFTPSGAASALASWAVEFRRPSVIRLFGHAWEWAGYLNYTKAIPKYQGQLSDQNRFTYYFTNVDGGRVYATGFNEEGYQVTPRGLEDIATGRTLSVENLGANDITLDTPTELSNLTLNGTTTINDELIINAANLNFPDTAKGTTEKLGIVELASAEALRSGNNVSGSTDLVRNTNISASPEVVTARGLEYWRVHNRLLSQRTGTQFVYVDPVNGAEITSIDALLGAPPISEESAVKTLTAAALYARSVFSPTETVEFRLGAGLYQERGVIEFTSITAIRAWDYAESAYLNNESDGGTVPFRASNFYNPASQPVFLTELDSDVSHSPQTLCIIYTYPLRLVFREYAAVTGIAWWGPVTTAGNSSVSDSFFRGSVAGQQIAASSSTPGNWRNLSLSDPDNAYNYFIRDHAMLTSPVSGQLYGLRLRPCMDFYAEGTVSNVAFGAMLPADFAVAGDDNNRGTTLLRVRTSNLLQLKGVSLIGNVKVSSEVNTGAYANIRLRNNAGDPAGSYSIASYFLTGHSHFIVSPDSSEGVISVGFTGDTPSSGDAGSHSRFMNEPYNNVQLMNSNSPPALASNTDNPTTSNWKNLGPAVMAFFDKFGEFKTISPVRNWSQYWVATSDGNAPSYGSNVTGSPGFDGVFGKYIDRGGSVRRAGGMYTYSGTKLTGFGADTYSTIFRKSGTGTIPANNTSGLSYGEIGTAVTFADLNINVRTINKGVDVVNATTAIVTCTL